MGSTRRHRQPSRASQLSGPMHQSAMHGTMMHTHRSRALRRSRYQVGAFSCLSLPTFPVPIQPQEIPMGKGLCTAHQHAKAIQIPSGLKESLLPLLWYHLHLHPPGGEISVRIVPMMIKTDAYSECRAHASSTYCGCSIVHVIIDRNRVSA